MKAPVETQKNDENRQVIYSPPPDKDVEKYARELCRVLGEGYTSNEVIDGFTDWMKILGAITTKYLNKLQGSQLDNEEK